MLILIARGGSTRQVARELTITPKTAETHIERIYAKTGATTRSTATLFALQHGLLGTLEAARSVGENPGRHHALLSVPSTPSQRITDQQGDSSWPARQSSASAQDSRTARRS